MSENSWPKGLRVILLGPPGSGKGTQSVGLAEELGVPHIATGDLFRTEMSEKTELGILAESFIAYGNLVPDDIVNRIMAERLGRDDAGGFVLDGYPRTLPQAESLEGVLEGLERPVQAAINIDVPDDLIVERAVGRLVCPDCGAIFHLTSKPPRTMGVCDVCRGQLQVRKDDQPSTVRHRLGVYHRITAPVLKFYESRDLLRVVDGTQSRDEVGKKVRAALRAL
ncbi:MAG TPA: adenylate kinase [Abditibacteriaceae bacterium]